MNNTHTCPDCHKQAQLAGYYQVCTATVRGTQWMITTYVFHCMQHNYFVVDSEGTVIETQHVIKDGFIGMAARR